MSPKSLFRLPELKLRGKIILAAAAIFSVALAVSLFYVVSTARQKDLATADATLAALADQRADDLRIWLTRYATFAEATAETAEAITLNPESSLKTFSGVAEHAAESVPDALGVLIMAATARRPSLCAAISVATSCCSIPSSAVCRRC